MKPEDCTAVVCVGVRDVQLELESAGSQERRIQDLDQVGRSDDEDHLIAMEPVHLGEELVDHRMLDPRAAYTCLGPGERIELVEHDDRRCRLPSPPEDLTESFLAFTDPSALQLGPGDDRDRRAEDDAIALANRVLPVPGGPQKINPRGIRSSSRVTSAASVAWSFLTRISRISARRRFLTRSYPPISRSRSVSGSSSDPVSVAWRSWL